MDIVITPKEQAQEVLSPANLSQAIKAIQTDGYVVLTNAIAHDHLDVLYERMTVDSKMLLTTETWGGAGRTKGHLQQGPPPFAPYVFPDIVANPFATQVTRTMLGDGVYNRLYNGNTNCPGSKTQPLHRDGASLWPDTPFIHPPTSLIINIALMDVNEKNGATELWPGTHLIAMSGSHVDSNTEARRREQVPPVQATTQKGSLLIRDHRLWHRGVPNYSNTIRHMIALMHNTHWLQRPCHLLFNQGCEDAFPDNGLDHNAVFTDRPLQYLSGKYATVKP
ncbi:MAG: phytanoyl-CoA dioxygenase family protein [Chloroflexota bacterium]